MRMWAILVLVCLVAVQAPEAWAETWAESLEGFVSGSDRNVAMDTAGNTYVTGTFAGIRTFGPFELSSGDNNAIFIAKLDPVGNWLWVRTAQVSDYVRAESVTVDSTGNLYVAGYFSGSATFGAIQKTASGLVDIFIAKLDPADRWIDNWVWVQTAAVSESVDTVSAAVDATNNVFVTGAFSGRATFGAVQKTAKGYPDPRGLNSFDLFIAKLNSAGDWLWVRTGESYSSDVPNSMAIDNTGNVYVTGYCGSNFATLGPFVLTDPGAFIAKLNPEGNWLWVQPTGGGVGVGSIVIDTIGNVYVTGGFSGITTFGAIELRSRGNSDIFIAKLNPTTGEPLWVQPAGGVGNDGLSSVAVDRTGNVYVTGAFEDQAAFGAIELRSRGGFDIFIAKFDPVVGQWLWAQFGGGTDNDYSSSIAVDPSGNAAITGSFRGTVRFGNKDLVSQFNGLNYSSFIAKLDTDGAWLDRYRLTISCLRRQSDQAAEEPCPYNFGNLNPRGSTWQVAGAVTVHAEPFIDPYVCAQWTGTGSIPARGFECDRAEVTLTQDSTLTWHYAITQTWDIGQAIPLPAGATAEEPEYLDASTQGAFFWSPVAHKLYAIRPVTASLAWKTQTDPAARIVTRGTTKWPATPQMHVANTPRVALELGRGGRKFVDMPFTNNDAKIDAKAFVAVKTGYSVLRYTVGPNGDPQRESVVFEIVRTVPWNAPAFLQASQQCTIGQALTDADHDDPSGGNGYVYVKKARYDAQLYNRAARTGPIFPVNMDSTASDDDMVVVWYTRSAKTDVAWPDKPVRYTCRWPTDAAKLIIASQRGSGALKPPQYPTAPNDITVYQQPDPTLPGYNPNEEHAAFFPPQGEAGARALFALRNDLNTPTTSAPYVLLKYKAPNTGAWTFKVYQVVAQEPPDPAKTLRYQGTAGTVVQAPYPVSLLQDGDGGKCPESSGVSGPYWEDYKGDLWAKAAGIGGTTADVVVRFFYRLQEGFFDDLDKNGQRGDAQVGDCIPWLDRLPGGTPGQPVDVTYTIRWPEAPELHVGEALTTAKRGLPDLTNQVAAEVIFDESSVRPDYPRQSLVKLLDPLSARHVALSRSAVPGTIRLEGPNHQRQFSDLPFHLRRRLMFNAQNNSLAFQGFLDASGAGEPLLLPNIMTAQERTQIKCLVAQQPETCGLANIPTEVQNCASAFCRAVDTLFHKTRNPNELDLDDSGTPDQAYLVGLDDANADGVPEPQRLFGVPMALSTGATVGTGYVTLAFNNDRRRTPEPVSLQIIKVVCPVYQGQMQVIPSDNVFDERLTLRHSGDFGGLSDAFRFEWRFTQDTTGQAPAGPFTTWQRFATTPANGQGAVDVTMSGPGLLTLTDNWFVVRYTGYEQACPAAQWGRWSAWAGAPGSSPTTPKPQLAEGWIKRVTDGLNPFEARVQDFHGTATNTVVSMVQQAGQRYEGDIALNSNPENLNNVGLIEAYTTVLRRGLDLSINGTPPVDNPAANAALLNAAGRLADLYMLLGNEAYADASDPTIGFGTASGEYGSRAPSIFTFQNQVDSLLEEELALLRGRDDTHASVGAPPVYNRLSWNFTAGEGEVAYAQHYNITDDDRNGGITEADARRLYPQGHGDAWGHYVTAIKTYYALLRHPHYTWEPRTESVLVAGVPVEVDYQDERKFARAAAAKARTGAEIVNLTYRQHYVEDPAGQWQGYKDSQRQRAWGLAEWARRAGQGTYVDWVVGNAILPAEDANPAHTGMRKVDRTTVLDLREVASHFQAIQAQVDTADQGRNPLGVVQGVVPFDISPSEIANGKTHFEQIYDRAVTAMNNAITVFNHANDQSQSLRRHQDTLADFRDNVQDREADFTNRLIEIFGYPYPDDIGSGGAYPSGYAGPDLIHYAYVDPSALLGVDPSQVDIQPFTVKWTDVAVGADGSLSKSTRNVTFHLSTTGLGLVKPSSWTGKRQAPGEIQLAHSDLLQSKARFERGLLDYDNVLHQIEDQAGLLQAQYQLNASEIAILQADRQRQTSLNAAIKASRQRQLGLRSVAVAATNISNALAEALPLSTGLSFDATSTIRSMIRHDGALQSQQLNQRADIESQAELDHQQAKEAAQALTNIQLTTLRNEFAGRQQLKQLEQLVRQEALLRLEVYTLQEMMQQTADRYLAALAKGNRLLEERERFRQQTAAKIQRYRYEDMAFRVFRNDALQKYRAQFDLAALYVYLAAKAYDYETNLLGTDQKAGQAFLTDIVRQRSLGQIGAGGLPLTGTGLADPLARMSQNFAVLKGQLGFTNPQTETNRFALRPEFLRISPSFDAHTGWHEALARHRVANLWDVPEFRRYCIPFADESAGPQPGLVIPFSTTITEGLNYFGWPLGGEDSAYDSTHFATKVRSVGVWFSNYNGHGLSRTPRVYLVPIGADVLRSPTGNRLATREWAVVDQQLPVPFSIGPADFANDRTWIPVNDTLQGELAAIRRFARFRAHHDSGTFTEAETISDSRLIGRSVWNTRWLLIIPGSTLLGNPTEGLETFIYGQRQPDGTRDGNGVTDIKIFFQTYAYQGR